ncbi:DUF4118 domain-containing protein [Streptomyces sp. NPDC048357]|uniref:DUF4118 domain-containing protein n=1 Tax=Streptomyces sp. NPDC048357 TaxID=3154719 RepID=UPI003414E298
MSGYSHRPQDRAVLLAALLVPFLVALALVPFRTGLSATNEALIMVVAVVAVAALGTRAAGALAALSAAAWFDFFLTRPYQQFAIADGDEIQTAVLLLVVGLIVSQLAVRVQRLRTVVVADASHLSSLQGTARLVEDGGSPEAVVEYVRRQLVGLLGLRVVGGGHCYGRFLLDPLPDRPLPPEEARLVTVALAAQAGAALDPAGLSHQG